jgi:hypothetical protein
VFATIGFVFAACDADDPATTSRPETTVLSTATNQSGDGSASGQRNPGNAYSSFGIYEAVNFASGTSGTTVSDGVVRGTVNGYLFGADSGQKFILNLVSANSSFDVYAPDDTLLEQGKKYAEISPLPAAGDYLVVVSSQFGNAEFDLITEITEATAMPTVAATCPNYVEFNDDYPMRQCHKGDEVRAVQQKLEGKGYTIDVDGFFGPGTSAVVQQLFVDGVAVLSQADIDHPLTGAPPRAAL